MFIRLISSRENVKSVSVSEGDTARPIGEISRAVACRGGGRAARGPTFWDGPQGGPETGSNPGDPLAPVEVVRPAPGEVRGRQACRRAQHSEPPQPCNTHLRVTLLYETFFGKCRF